jgi:hypothetical protein
VKRTLLAVVALLSLASCAVPDRPEGIVERWLLALNQGSAGEPMRYAYRDVSSSVLPNWKSADPGAFDVIEVGRARPCSYRGPAACVAMVPFRAVLADGGQVRFDALVGVDRRSTGVVPSRVFGVTGPSGGNLRLPSEGGPPIGAADTLMWLAALGVAIALALVGEIVMRLVRPSPA